MVGHYHHRRRRRRRRRRPPPPPPPPHHHHHHHHFILVFRQLLEMNLKSVFVPTWKKATKRHVFLPTNLHQVMKHLNLGEIRRNRHLCTLKLAQDQVYNDLPVPFRSVPRMVESYAKYLPYPTSSSSSRPINYHPFPPCFIPLCHPCWATRQNTINGTFQKIPQEATQTSRVTPSWSSFEPANHWKKVCFFSE